MQWKPSYTKRLTTNRDVSFNHLSYALKSSAPQTSDTSPVRHQGGNALWKTECQVNNELCAQRVR